jgi:trimeric autotransporter adhesin
MKTKILFSVLFTFVFCLLSSQVPQGFNYQAAARDAVGDPIKNKPVIVRISVQPALTSGNELWIETHSITTDAYGVMVLVVGKGSKAGGTATNFSDINWGSQTLYLKTEIKYPTTNPDFFNMGTSQFWSVPYSLVSSNLGGPVKNLSVKGETTSFDEALFEVKNNTGQTVFAVYNEGIRAYVDNGKLTKGAKGGFAIGGFGTTKTGESQNLMMISPDSARIYVDETAAKGSKGGFAIGGFNTSKGTIKEFMLLTPANYFIGHNSGQAITSGLYNSTLGYESGKGLTEGSNNVLIGYQSGIGTVGGGSNVFIGTQAGFTNTSGNYNIELGRQAGYYSTASSNIFLGDLTAYWNTSGDQNVMIGDWAGYHNTEGFQNVFLGAEAGWFNKTGSNNIFMGFESGYHNDSGNDNIAIGNKAGTNNLTGTYNVMIGSDAGYTNTAGDFNTMIGYKAGEQTTADYGTMLGYLAGNSTTSGLSQTMLGYMAGSLNTGSFNTYVGTLAGGNNASGSFNTYVGLAAGKDAPGSNNVFIGKWAGWAEAGSDKLIIENNYSDPDNLNNALIYGDFVNNYLKVNGDFSSVDNVISDDNPGVLGKHSVSAFWGIGVQGIGGYIGVKGESNLAGSDTRIGVQGSASGGVVNYGVYGTASGGTAYAGYFNGNVYTNGSVSATSWITLSSDKKLKKNIVPLSGSLEKVLNLQGVSYEWKSESELTIDNIRKKNVGKEVDPPSFNFPEGKQLGVIAQDVEKILPELVHSDADGLKSVDYIKIVPLLIEAIKEQQKQIEELKTKVNILTNQIK